MSIVIMVIIFAIPVALFMVALFLCRNRSVSPEFMGGSGCIRAFAGLAEWLLDVSMTLPGIRGRRSLSAPQLGKELGCLLPGTDAAEARRLFQIKRLAMVLAVLFCGSVLCLLVSLKAVVEGAEATAGEIIRGDYAEADRTIELLVDWGDIQGERISLTLGAREYEEEELEALFQQFTEALPELIKQSNNSLDEITEDLYLAEQYEGYPFLVSWYCRAGSYLSDDGHLLQYIEQPIQTRLEAVIEYEDKEWEYALDITLLPTELSLQERERKELEEFLLQSERQSRTGEVWELPTKWREQELSCQTVTQNYAWELWILVVVAAIAVYLLADREVHDKYLDRQRQLRGEYPELLHKLVLYMGAGLTIRGSLLQIHGEYERKGKGQPAGAVQKGKGQPAGAVPKEKGLSAGAVQRGLVYEEIGYVCRALQTGASEIEAYEELGRRTGLQEYIRLCTLLVQNLQKGNNELLERLRAEAREAQLESIRNCKRAAEEAQTKLLLPLVLMLIVVMLMILLPAFSMTGI